MDDEKIWRILYIVLKISVNTAGKRDKLAVFTKVTGYNSISQKNIVQTQENSVLQCKVIVTY